jgi:cell division protein FtsQ
MSNKATDGEMFGRNTNRRRRSWSDRFSGWCQAGWQWLRRAAPWLAAVVVAVGLPYGAVYLYLGAASSTHFDIDTVTVEGADYLNGSKMAREAHIVEGMNVLDIDEARAEQTLQKSAWVREATVETQLPGEAVVTLEEREPVALLADAKWAIVDRQGNAFKLMGRGDPIERLLDLPLVTGLDAKDMRRPSGQQWLERALRAGRLYRTFGLAEEAPLSEIHVDRTMGISLITVDGTEIRLGRERFRQRLGRLGAVRRELTQRSVQPSYILMDLGEPLRRAAIGRRHPNQGRSGEASGPHSGSATGDSPPGGGADRTREGH